MTNNPPKNNTPDKALVERARQICADVRPDYASGFLSGEYDQSSTEMRVAIAALSQHGGLVEEIARIIDPYGFSQNEMVSYAARKHYRDAAYEKADAIASLIAGSGEQL